jgi:uncharacterized membrane protein YdbT with pleckstrin-like domain
VALMGLHTLIQVVQHGLVCFVLVCFVLIFCLFLFFGCAQRKRFYFHGKRIKYKATHDLQVQHGFKRQKTTTVTSVVQHVF